MSNLQLSAREAAVHHSPDRKRISVLQFGGKGGIREILIADGTGKAKYRLRADGGGTAVGAGRIGSTVNHGVTNFNARGVAVEKDAADFVFQHFEQVGELPKVFLSAVNRGGEMATETSSGAEKVLLVGETNQ